VRPDVRIVPRLARDGRSPLCCAAQGRGNRVAAFSGRFSTTLYDGVVQRKVPILASEFGEHVGEDRWG